MLNKILRILLGLVFVAFGLNGFFRMELIPVPDFHPFMQILVSSGYIYVVKMVNYLNELLKSYLEMVIETYMFYQKDTQTIKQTIKKDEIIRLFLLSNKESSN